jgi:hypothetical protein
MIGIFVEVVEVSPVLTGLSGLTFPVVLVVVGATPPIGAALGSYEAVFLGSLFSAPDGAAACELIF